MATFTVTTTNDSGAGSLREAVDLANANADADTITFDASLSGQTITLTGSELLLTQDVTIDGDMDGDNKADITISGNDGGRVFRMTGASTDVDLLSLTLTKGRTPYFGSGGGAIYAQSISTLDIQDTTIKNSVSGSGGGLAASATDVTLTNSLVTGNSAAFGYGGGINLSSSSTLAVTNSTIHGNSSFYRGGGISLDGSAMTLVNSTVTGNHGFSYGVSAIGGGGIDDHFSTITVINSVLAENTSGTTVIANDVYGTIDTATNSVFETAVTITTNTNSLTGVADVGLGALADNGGTVMTRLALSGSVLIDAGDDASAPTGTAANGLPRLLGDHVDIGAAESPPATLVVDEGGDVVDGDYSAGHLSLREAVTLANMIDDANTITFDASLSGQTITLTGGELVLTQDVTIDGDTDGDNKADITISGNNASRVFLMTGGSTDVDLLSLTLANGSTAGDGGAVFAQDISTLDIQDTSIKNSAASWGGGLNARGTDVTLTNSLMTGNAASNYGGGIYVRYFSTLVVTNSTIDGNTANSFGGGLSASYSTVTLLNSAVTGNQADADGGSTYRGGGIEDFASTITVINSVVAENTSGTSMTANDVYGTIDTATNSVFETAVTITTNTNSLTGVADVGLGALADNGGTVMTRLALSGSVLIDAGDDASAPTGTAANGLPRLLGDHVDIGAAESPPATLVVDEGGDVVDGDYSAGHLSLREAVTLANMIDDANTITFDASLSGQTITLTGGELVLTQDVTIDGDTDGDNKADITISGNNASRVFSATGDFTDVDLLSLTLANGNISSTGSGGAIVAQSISTLDIQDTTIKDSAALKGGGVASFGTAVTLTNSLVTGNAATFRGGGIYLMTASTLTVTNSTIHGNTANRNGGGIYASLSSVDLLNSTVTGNQADADGGDTAAGGGIDDFLSTITVINSVVAENTSGTSMTANDVNDTIDTATNSVFGTAVTITTNTDSLTGVTEVGLGAMADNGGTVMTRNIESGSVLINAGDNASAAGLATDANGNDRISFGKVDVGATEFTGPFVVDEAGDTVDGDISAGHLSLREAVALANLNADASTITFDAGLAGETIILTGGQLLLTQDVTIDGDTDGDHKADITISGNNASRVFLMTGASTDVDLLSLTLTKGFSGGDGGAVLASSIATLDIQDTTIRDSSAGWGGGLNALGTDVTLTNSLVTGNTADDFGGGVYVRSSSTLAVTNSTIHGNTVNGNGGGISASASTLTLLNSTVTGNQADADGGDTAAGGGIENFVSTITVINSVVAENTSGTSMTANDMRGTVNTADHSFFGTTVTITTDNGGNLNGAGNPLLGELLDNGGTVLTRSPLDGSPLIGAGSNALLPADIFDIDHDGDTAETLPLDGRDGLRLAGGTLDIGTVEQIEDEVINGTPGRNIVIGGLGVDILNGRGGRDTVRGGDDDDTVYGGRGVDLVSGNGGRDKLNGGKGADTLNGGADGDFLTGGDDADVFQFNNVAHSAQGPGLSDTIKDFTQGEDVMDLANAFAFTFMGETEFTGVAGELIQRTSGSDVLVLGDTDGDTRTDFRIILEGAAGMTLTLGDFVL